MPLLRLSNGTVYADTAEINRIIAPIQVGRFDVSAAFLEKVQAMKGPITQQEALQVFDALDPKLVAKLDADGFKYRRIGNLVPKDDGGFTFALRFKEAQASAPDAVFSKELLDNYLTPHYMNVNDCHFLFAGTIIKGMQLDNDLQAAVYILPGEWIRLSPKVLNWPVFPQGPGCVAISCFDLPAEQHKFDLRPNLQVKPEMRF